MTISHERVISDLKISTNSAQMSDKSSSISDAHAIAIAIAYAFIIFFGSVSNALVAITYVKWRRTMLKEPRDVLIFSLAIGDFVMTSFVSPFALSSAISRKWTANQNACVWYGFASAWIGLSSMLQLAAIALERWYTFSYSTYRFLSTKHVVKIITACWIIAFVACCFPLIGWSRFTLEGFGFHCSIVWNSASPKNTSYCLFLLVFFFAIPVAAIALSYTKQFLVIRRMFVNAEEMWGRQSRATRQSCAAQVKISKQLLIVIVGFLFAWTPYATISSIKVFSDKNFDQPFDELPSLFAKTSNIYNPIIYFFTYKRLRRKLCMIIRRKICRIFDSVPS